MNPLHNLGRTTLSLAGLLMLLALAGPSQGGDKDKDKGKDNGKETTGLSKPFEQVTVDASALDKQFKVLKVDSKTNEQNLYTVRLALLARQKLTPEMLNDLLSKTEVRFYAGEIIVGRYPLHAAYQEQITRGLVQDEKILLKLQLPPDQVNRLKEEMPTKAALVKTP